MLKTGFSISNILLQFMSGVCLNCNGIFSFRKTDFYRLLKVIGIQKKQFKIKLPYYVAAYRIFIEKNRLRCVLPKNF